MGKSAIEVHAYHPYTANPKKFCLVICLPFFSVFTFLLNTAEQDSGKR